MFMRRRIKYFELVGAGETLRDKLKMLLLALFFILPNRFTNKDAHTSDFIIEQTRNLRLSVNGHHYKLIHPRQLFMITNWYEYYIRPWFNIEGDTFLDVGANIGRYTLMLHQNFKQVHSFEPIDETYKILEYNINSNHIMNVKTHKLAAWNQHETLTFYLKNNPGGNSSEITENAIGETVVQAAPLDTMINIFGKVDLIKMDIEGAEPQALEGMKQIITRDKPTIIVEVLERNNEQVYRLMHSLGYMVTDKRNRNTLFKPC